MMSPGWSAREAEKPVAVINPRSYSFSPIYSRSAKREHLALHQDQRVIGPAADGALHVIREVALEDAHLASLVIGHDVSCQGAFKSGALVDELEVVGHEGRDGVPSVDLILALVAEEKRAAVVRAQDDYLLRFLSAIVYLALGVTAPEMVRSDGEQPTAAQVREEQAGATIMVAYQSEIEYISAIAVHGHR